MALLQDDFSAITSAPIEKLDPFVVQELSSKSQEWMSHKLGHDRLLFELKSRTTLPTNQPYDALGHAPINIFFDLLIGLHRNKWTGVIGVDTVSAQKKIYFSNGEFVFAASNQIDDRLGEILYREGLITIDQLTSCAAQVTRETKFGQVLVQHSILTRFGLWQALKTQVFHILQSVFMTEGVFYSLQKSVKPFTCVVFEQGSQNIFQSCANFGAMYRGFLGNLALETPIHLIENRSKQILPGTYKADLVNLLQQSQTIAEFLEASKLQKSYSLASLLHSCHDNLCSVVEGSDDSYLKTHHPQLADTISCYNRLALKTFEHFKKIGTKFPNKDLEEVLESLTTNVCEGVFLNSDGTLSKLSYQHIAEIFKESSGQSYEFVFEAMEKFLDQLTK